MRDGSGCLNQDDLNGTRGSARASASSSAASAVAPDKRANLYTRHAEEAVNSAALINSAFRKRVVGSAVPRHIEVAPPSGPSTSGGKKARQSITLVQVTQQSAAVMIGFLDVAQKSAGVREYEPVAKQYEARFRTPFETTREEYEGLTRELTGMLTTLGYQLVPDEPRDEPRSAPAPEATDRKPFLIAGALVLLAVLALILTRL